MARRRNIGGDDEDYAAFLASRQQQADPRMAMAMQIMGMMEKSQSEQQRQALDERQQAALEKYQSGQLGIEEAKRKTAETEAQSLAGAREAEKTYRIQQGMDAAGKEATRQKEEADKLALTKAANEQARAVSLVDALVRENKIAVGDPEYTRLMERATPGYGEESKQIAEAARGRKIAEGVTKYTAATPEAKKAYNAASFGVPQDVFDEILKQSGVQVAQPGTPPAVSAGGGGLSGGIADVLWNLPGGVENLFRMGANLGSTAWYGKGAPQYPLMPWTHAADEWTKGGPTVAPPPAGPTPMPQYGNYGQPVADVSTPPEWQYGVGQQRPPPQPLNDLLAKALQNQ